MGHDSANQRHDVDSIDFAIIIGVVGTGGWIWQRYEKPEAIVVTTLLALVLFVMRYSATFWQLLAYLYENTSNEDVGYVARGSLMADVIPGIARALPQERPVKSFVTTQQPRLLPPPKDITSGETVTAPHVSRKPVDVTETRSTGERVMLRKEVVTLPGGRTVDLPREVTPVSLPELDLPVISQPKKGTPPLQPVEQLLMAVDSVFHLAVIGDTGTGKTVFLNNLCYRAMQQHKQVVILDPHATPNKWPKGALVIGAGLAYGPIGEMLLKIESAMRRRYSELATGTVQEGDHPYIYVFADEWYGIVKSVEGGGDILGTLICEARKVNIKVILGSQSGYLTALGLEDSAIRDSLKKCTLRKRGDSRYAEFEGASYLLPRPLPRGLFENPQRKEEIRDDISKKAEAADEVELEAETQDVMATLESKREVIRGLLRQRKSQRDIIKEVWGVDGGNGYIKAAAELTEIISGMV